MPDNKSFLDTLAKSDQPESFAAEKFDFVKNTGSNKKILVGALIAAILLIGAFAYYYATSMVKVPELAGQSLDEATVWAQNNKIVLVAKSVYSFEDEENKILSQEIEAGKSIKKNSTLPIKVSLGPDPEEVIAVPDLESMTTSEIELWISENKLTGTKLVTANSNVVEANHVISYSFTDGSEDSFKRKNRLTINVSIGSETLSETVVVSDFSTLKAAGVLQWGANNGVIITLLEEFDEYSAAGSVISQSVSKDTEIKRTDGIIVVISKGKAVTVPNFASMSKEEANAWAKFNNVTLTILDKYSDSLAKGKLFSQTITSGASIKVGDELRMYYSLGKVDVASFIGKTKLDFLNWQNEVNGKDANIRLLFSEAYGEKGTYGKIISQSIKNDYVQTGTEIRVVVSNGMDQVEVGSFIGKTKLDIINWQKDVNAENANIQLSFSEAYGEKGTSGKIISQSVKNDYVFPGTEIEVVISKGMRVAVPDFSGKTESECNNIANNSSLNILFDYRNSETVRKGYVISQTPVKNTVITDSEPVTIVISMTETPANKVVVADFSAMKASAIKQWGIDNGVTVMLAEVYDSFVSSGSVVSQSISKDKLINKTDTIVVYISAGKAPAATPTIIVPNFSTMNKDEANSWAKLNNITLSFVEKYSNVYTKGSLLNQSALADSGINVGSTIKIYYSLGKVEIGDFSVGGKTKLDVLNWESTVNEKGGSITVEFKNQSGTITGQAVKINGVETPIKNDLVDVGSTMVFTLSI